MSIQRQLLALIISVVTLAIFIAALHGYRNGLSELETAFDKELVTVASFINDVSDEEVAANNLSRSDKLVYQIQLPDGRILSNINDETVWFGSEQTGFSEVRFANRRWRSYSIIGFDKSVMVAHPIQQRLDVAESVLLSTITPLVVSLAFLALIIGYIIRLSLAPLEQLSRQLKQKSSDDMSHIALPKLPDELEPVVDRINSLLSRLDMAFERERHLSANAAHELRTPISVLTINCHNIIQDFQNNELKQNDLVELEANIERLAHVVEQIIALYRYSQESFADRGELVSLEPLLQQLISDNFDALERQHQQIELISDPISTIGEEFALYTLFENLLRNAIKYGGEHAHIRVSLKPQADVVLVVVEDSGQGVADDQFERIFERFYRVSENKNVAKVKGSGLGLSIVMHIAKLHQGVVTAKRSELGGLAVCVTLPRAKMED